MSAEEIDEQRILSLLATDRARGVELMFDTYYAQLCRTAYRIVPDQHAAEDLVQDTFLGLWKKPQLLRVNRSLGAYLRRAVVNRALNYRRDRKPAFDRPEALPEQAASPAPPPGSKLSEADLQTAIDRAIDDLPERCRLVFILSRFEEMTYQEIASALDISPKTVENQIAKALAQLRQRLKPYMLPGILALISLV